MLSFNLLASATNSQARNDGVTLENLLSGQIDILTVVRSGLSVGDLVREFDARDDLSPSQKKKIC